MRALQPTRRAALALALGWTCHSCALDVSEKRACRSSDDCVGARVCIDGTCEDSLCAPWCQSLCAWALSCSVIDELDACINGCEVAASDCAPPVEAETSCSTPSEARCFELIDAFGPDVDCDDPPCTEDTDCAPTSLCDIDHRCRKRCTDDYECPAGECYSDHCTEDVGVPCDQDTLSWCGGGRCINVDASNRTVSPYCTVSCILIDCPSGFVCFDETECRKP